MEGKTTITLNIAGYYDELIPENFTEEETRMILKKLFDIINKRTPLISEFTSNNNFERVGSLKIPSTKELTFNVIM